MLTNLNRFKEGYRYPIVEGTDRIENYRLREKQYDGTYNEGKKLRVMTTEGLQYYNWKLQNTNYYKLMTDKFVGLILNEEPNVKVLNKETTKVVNEILKDIDFWQTIKSGVESFSQYGDSVLMVHGTETEPKITVVPPNNWYKIVSQLNINDIKNHVLVQEIETYRNEGGVEVVEVKHVRIITHYKGYYTERIHVLRNNTIGEAVDYEIEGYKVSKEGNTVITGLSDFAIQVMHNSKTINSAYGISDYKMLEEVVYEYEKRTTVLSAILDKHSEPTMVIDEVQLENDINTGEQRFNGIGNIIAIDSGGVKPEYITWDAKTEASEKEIERLEKHIIRLTEYGEGFLFGSFGVNASGEAIKNSIKIAGDKVARQVLSISPTVKKVIKLILELRGIEVNLSDITVEWQDGIKENSKDVSEVIRVRKESGTISTETALINYYGMTEEQAKEEVERIENEERRGVEIVSNIQNQHEENGYE